MCNGYTTVSTVLSDPTPGGTWSICCGTASISPTGVVTGLTLGSTNVVSYTMPNNCYVIAPIVVDTLPAPIMGLDSICKYASTFLTDATAGGVWSSSNGTIATAIAATGEVIGVVSGTVHITYTSISGCYVTKPFKVREPLPASVTMTYAPNLDTLCAGTPVTFTATPVNGGAAPSYQWQLFGVNVGTGGNTFTYTPTHGDVLWVYMTRDAATVCSAPIPAHDVVAINVYPNIFPIVTITTSASGYPAYWSSDSLRLGLLGRDITFYSEVTNAGVNHTYQWIVDHTPVPGATNATFVRTVYDDDSVYCVVNGNPKCASTYLSTSNQIFVYANYLATTDLSTANATLSLFPNPNTGNFTLKGAIGSSTSTTVSIEVTDMLGQVIYTGTTQAINRKVDKQIDLGNKLAPGSYMLRVSADNDNQAFHFVVGQ